MLGEELLLFTRQNVRIREIVFMVWLNSKSSWWCYRKCRVLGEAFYSKVNQVVPVSSTEAAEMTNWKIFKGL